MKITQKEFKERFDEAQEQFLIAAADHPEIDLEKFYSITCFLENLSFFSPIIYGLIKQKGESDSLNTE